MDKKKSNITAVHFDFDQSEYIVKTPEEVTVTLRHARDCH